MQSLIVVARLRPGVEAEVRELIAQGPPLDLQSSGLTRNTIYLSENEVVFLFEGPDAERVMHEFLNDPVASARLASWGHLIDGTPFMARREFDWQAS
ncbi:MAG: hypothetical protein HY827_07950 [Actinobacteria bacterium]|nr:hypothetical protein [Actinomycetota bacterium]